jgi:DNA-binding beta-propeller fold protein YncE
MAPASVPVARSVPSAWRRLPRPPRPSALVRALSLSCLYLALLAGVTAQGEFVNFEPPQVRPIAVATIGGPGGLEGQDALVGQDVLLCCNTPGNSVDVFEASAPYTFLFRVPVGLAPVTVRWHEERSSFYSCNFVGDSVTRVELTRQGGQLTYTVHATTFVGDEPCDIYFLGNPGQDDEVAWVTLNTRSAVAGIRPDTLATVLGEFPLLDQSVAPQLAVKQARAAEALPDGRAFIANFMGDEPVSPSRNYDFDLYVWDPTSPTNPMRVTGLGTTHHSFTIDDLTGRMYVVGTRAQHQQAAGVHNVAALPTGFVQSWLWVVDVPLGAVPTVQPEALPGPTASPYHSIDLNRAYNGTPPIGQTRAAVPPGDAIAQPTDVLVFRQPGAEDEGEKLFLAMYHSDRVAVLEPDATKPGGWAIRRIALNLRPNTNYSVVGPRGLAQSATATDPDQAGTSGLVYALNRLDNSVSVIDPVAEIELARFALSVDPTPPAIRAGREFLYSARFSGNGAVSCASCHVDGRTDGLAWDLGESNPMPPFAIDPWLLDGNFFSSLTMPDEKGLMVTQTLQGLVNSLVNAEMQVLFTNAPYHWRGDKRSVDEFNEAYVNLQGMPSLTAFPSGPQAEGITPQQMQTFVKFVNTIVHPPNPEQHLARVPRGSLDTSTVANANDPTNPNNTGEMLGMLGFVNVPSVATRSCVDCHSLPDGSSNTMTCAFFAFPVPPTNPVLHPIETAATRNLFQREAVALTPLGPALTANYGLLHPGDPGFFSSLSIDSFVSGTFGNVPFLPVAEVTQFMRAFDTGIAPAAGLAYTLDGTTDDRFVLDLLEGQVRQANIGLAVYTRDALGAERGYWFDLDAPGGPAYRESGTTTTIGRPALRGIQGAGGLVVLQGTPVGSERRIASLTGVAPPAGAGAPVNIAIEPMRAATHWEILTNFVFNEPFGSGLPPSVGGTGARLTHLESRYWLRDAITQGGTSPAFGLPASFRHEPPRRFAVSGDGILPGAFLVLEMPVGAPQTSATPPRILTMNLFPTDQTNAQGRRIWETTVEADETVTLALLNGGLFAPEVVSVLRGQYPVANTTPPVAVPPLQPQAWNAYRAVVVNPNGQISTPTPWTPLTVQ